MTAATATAWACTTPWCTDAHNAVFRSALINDPTVIVEIHTVPIGKTLAVCQQEQVHPDGHTVLEPAYVASYVEELGSNPDAIAQYGADVIAAAEKLREVTS